jgi:hypothetical protein
MQIRPLPKRHDPPNVWTVPDPMRQGVGLARSRPGDDEQRGGQTAGVAADTMFDGPPLLGI